MAAKPETHGAKLSTGQLVVALLAAVGTLVCLGALLISQGKGAAWTGANTGFAVVAGLLALVSSWLLARPAAAAFGPAEGGRPLWQSAAGLAGLQAAVGCVLVLLVHQIVNQPWGKADTVLVVVALLGLGGAAAVWREVFAGSLQSRGTMWQLNAGVVTLLVLGIIFLLNYFVVPRRLGFIKHDFTEKKFYSLSEQTVNVLKSVKKDDPIEILGLLPSDKYSQDTHVTKRRFEDYQRQSPNVTVKILDPNLDLDARKLYQDGVVTTLPAVVVRYQKRPEVREAVSGTEEQDITKALLKLTIPSSRKIYFLAGHGEADLDSFEPEGVSNFKKFLENDRYECAKLELFKEAAVPTDAAALVIIGPKLAMAPEELQRIESYLVGGGRLLLALDPDSKSNAATLTEKYGIKFHAGNINDPVQLYFGGDPRLFVGQQYGDHETVSFFKRAQSPPPAVFYGAGWLTQDTAAGDYTLTDLVKTSPTSYGEAFTAAPAKPGQPAPAGERTNGPLTCIMVSSTKDPEPPKDEAKDAKQPEPPKTTRIRVAAVADGDFLANRWPANQVINANVAANLVAWLTDNTQTLGIRAKNPGEDAQSRPIKVDAKGLKWILVLTLFAPLLVIICAGVAVQLARR